MAAYALLLGAARLLAPPAAAAQSTPIVRIEPASHTVVGGNTLTVTVYWCGDRFGFDETSRLIRLNGVNVTASFTVESWGYTGCTYAQKSVGTITLTQPTNELFASISGPTYPQQTGAAARIYSLPPTPRGVSVSALGQYVDALAATSTERTYAVLNTGARRDTFDFVFRCTGQAAPCTVWPTTGRVVVDSGQSANVWITYPVSGTIGARGTATLVATSRADNRVVDSAVVEITSIATTPEGVTLARATDVIERDLCVTAAVTGAMVQCGGLVIPHPLPSVRTMNRAWTPTLVYNSLLATPRPVVTADVTILTQPDSVTARLLVGGVQKVRGKWAGSAWWNTRPRRIGLIYDAVGDSTGSYNYTFEVTKWVGTTPTVIGAPTGQLISINRAASPFGAGWWLSGLERLYAINDGTNRRLWVAGDGSARIYSPSGTTNVWLATVIDRPDTLIWDPGTATYRRLLPSGGRIEFNGAGQHLASVPRVGNATYFDYNNAGQLRRIRIPTPAGGADSTVQYEFAYSTSSVLDSATIVSRAAGTLRRTVSFTKNAGRITEIREPPTGVDTPKVTFEYLSPSIPQRIHSRTDRNGTKTLYNYERAFTLYWVRTALAPGDTVYTTLYDALERGIHDGTVGNTATHPDSTYTLINGPRSDVADHTKIWVNRLGAPIRTRDALGNETQITYSSTWPGLATLVRNPNRAVATATYHATCGVLLTTTDSSRFGDSRHPTTRYEWDAKWRSPTRIVQPALDSVVISYDATTGNRMWEQPGNDATRRTTYRYDSYGRVTRVFPPGVAAGVGDSIAYESTLSNISATLTPKGNKTTYRRDGFGRETFVSSPIDPVGSTVHSPAWSDSVITTYDIPGRVKRAITYAPVDETGRIDSVAVEHTYDAEGRVRITERQFMPTGGQLLARLQSSWQYDALGRDTQEVSQEGGIQRFVYDKAGNRLQAVSARGYTITAEYDVLNRVSRRITPQVTYGQTNCVWLYVTFSSCYYSMPTRGSSVVIPADTSVLAYDRAGNTIRADNRYARIRRTYAPSGVLTSDTLRTRSYFGSTADELEPLGAIVFPEGWNAGGGGDPQQQLVARDGPGGLRQPARKRPGRGGGSAASLSVTGGGVTVPDAYAVGIEADFAQHVYGLRFHYDLNGRRDTLYHPLSVALCGGPCAKLQSYAYDPLTGALSGVKDLFDYQHTIQYDVAGRVSSTQSPGWTVTRGYDDDGNMTPYTTSAPLTGGSVSLSYDARGRVLLADHGGGHTESSTYSGLGPVLRTVGLNDASPLETFQSDALGTRKRSTRYVNNPGSGDNGVRWYESTVDGKLQHITSDAGLYSFSFDETYQYDQAGNTEQVYRTQSTSGAVKSWETRSYYGADEKLRVFSRFAGIGPNSDPTMSGRRAVFEEYRYDALGRRVLVRSRRDANCTTLVNECRSYIERTVWDGDDVLYEIRSEGKDSTSSGTLESEAEVVAYTHALGIDAPVSVLKGSAAIVPHANWRGSFDGGTLLQGSTQTELGCASCATSPLIRWPGLEESLDGAPLSGDLLYDWYGNLIDGRHDGSGQTYLRNRYYDPASGRFTQKDPIGLAGGLNSYGFGAGDRVNYSDPFGLCPPNDADITTCDGFFTLAGAALGALVGGTAGGGAGLVVAAPTGEVAAPITVPALSAAGALKGAAIGATIGAGLDVLMSSNVGRMNKEIRTGRAPDGVKRVDKGKVTGEQDHVHFRDGSALNEDGTWKHGGAELTRAIRDWLTKWDWKLPQ